MSETPFQEKDNTFKDKRLSSSQFDENDEVYYSIEQDTEKEPEKVSAQQGQDQNVVDEETIIINKYKDSSIVYLRSICDETSENNFMEINENLKKQIFDGFDNLTDEKRAKVIAYLKGKEQEFYESHVFSMKFNIAFKREIKTKNFVDLVRFLTAHSKIPKYFDYYFVVSEKCFDLLKSYKIKAYRKYMRGNLLAQTDWNFDIKEYEKVQKKIREDLLNFFHQEMTKFAYVERFYPSYSKDLANQFEIESEIFRKEFEIVINYQEFWQNFYQDNIFYMHAIKLQNKHVQIMDKLLKTITFQKSDWHFNVIKKIFQSLLRKNNENFENELDILVELLHDKVQAEFESYLKAHLLNEFQTWKHYKTLIKCSVKNMEKYFDSDSYETEIFINNQDKLKNKLEQHLEHYTSKQKYLFEKVKNIQKKCCEQSVELYFNLIEENKFASSNDELFQEAIEHSEKIASNLKDDFTEELYLKILADIRKEIISKINMKDELSGDKNIEKQMSVLSETSVYFSFNEDVSDESDLKNDLQELCHKLETFINSNENTPGILRRQIESEIRNTKEIIESNITDNDIIEGQIMHLNKLYSLSK